MLKVEVVHGSSVIGLCHSPQLTIKRCDTETHLMHFFYAVYSWTVNVSCFPVRDSNRFGGLMSRIAQMATANPMAMNDVTNRPDQIGTVVNPMQSHALPNLVLPSSAGWTWNSKIQDTIELETDTEINANFVREPLIKSVTTAASVIRRNLRENGLARGLRNRVLDGLLLFGLCDCSD